MSETTTQQRRFWVREEVTYRLYLTLNRSGPANQDDCDAAVELWWQHARARGAEGKGHVQVTVHHPVVQGLGGSSVADSAQLVVTGLITLGDTDGA